MTDDATQPTEPQQQVQWRIVAPTSKADKDAIARFQRCENRRQAWLKQMQVLQHEMQAAFDDLVKRKLAVQDTRPVASTAAAPRNGRRPAGTMGGSDEHT
jgi:hypothetical protein